MPLRKASGNMYSFVSHTFNPIKGKCYHDCSYCYMKKFKLPVLYLDEKELKTDLGKGNFIFVGSGTDMFAENMVSEWVFKVLNYCKKFDNKYLFQTKNPGAFLTFQGCSAFPPDSVYGTTIETNRHYEKIMCNAPPTHERALYMSMIRQTKMVTIEPILDFDESPLFDLIDKIKPAWVNIGADSKGHTLPEPETYKIKYLIENLRRHGYEVKLKKNLSRIYKEAAPSGFI